MTNKDFEKIMKAKHICTICKKEYTGWGNNAMPINRGRCCDDCNSLVITARIHQLTKGKEIVNTANDN